MGLVIGSIVGAPAPGQGASAAARFVAFVASAPIGLAITPARAPTELPKAIAVLVSSRKSISSYGVRATRAAQGVWGGVGTVTYRCKRIGFGPSGGKILPAAVSGRKEKAGTVTYRCKRLGFGTTTINARDPDLPGNPLTFQDTVTGMGTVLDSFIRTGSATVTVVPEPSSFILATLASLGLVKCAWRRRLGRFAVR